MNYRGSAGRGDELQEAIFADWGDKEVVDLLAAVDHVVRRWASPIRSGWASAAGATAASSRTTRSPPTALQGRDQRRRQRLPARDVRRRPIHHAVRRTRSARRGRTQEPWIKISYPFFHADRIKTPTLFLGGEKDFNVPLVGGEQMYQALQEPAACRPSWLSTRASSTASRARALSATATSAIWPGMPSICIRATESRCPPR